MPTDLFEYHFNIFSCVWDVIFIPQHEIVLKSFLTEQEAIDFCEKENKEAKTQTIE